MTVVSSEGDRLLPRNEKQHFFWCCNPYSDNFPGSWWNAKFLCFNLFLGEGRFIASRTSPFLCCPWTSVHVSRMDEAFPLNCLILQFGHQLCSGSEYQKWRIIKLCFQPGAFLDLLIHTAPAPSVSFCPVCRVTELSVSSSPWGQWGIRYFLSVGPCLFLSRWAAEPKQLFWFWY